MNSPELTLLHVLSPQVNRLQDVVGLHVVLVLLYYLHKVPDAQRRQVGRRQDEGVTVPDRTPDLTLEVGGLKLSWLGQKRFQSGMLPLHS